MSAYDTTDYGSAVSGAPVSVNAGGFGNNVNADWGDPLDAYGSGAGRPAELTEPTSLLPLVVAVGALVLVGLVLLTAKRKGA